MTITKYLHDDKKEKHSSIELKVSVPTISSIILIQNDLYNCTCEDKMEYLFYFDSIDEANKGLDRFIDILSKEYNKHKSCFVIIDGNKSI